MSNINKQGRQVQRYANYGVDMMEWADGGYVKHSDYLALLDELEALQSFRTAYMEWSDKTDWVQTDKRLDVIKPWGKHRADVMKLYIDHLKSNLETAEHTAAVDHEAACSLVEENEELKRKLEAAEKHIAELEARSTLQVDYFASLISMARLSADKAMRKFPQPNYVLLKVAEEAGEVVQAGVHYAENRMTWNEVEGEIVQLLAMLIRLVTEGDQINGVTPPQSVRAAGIQSIEGEG
ncbi:hypothetical protein [Citrobacter koseri]|uniref:hypothetical protein n=1 Tax=Citrobacter koseri TaxID=545 RepID=UPI003EDEB393